MQLRTSGGGGGGGASAHTKLFAEWTKSGGSDSDGGVNLEMAFSEFDSSRNGTVEGSDLYRLLQGLGVQSNEDRLREAWEVLDNGDGSVEFSDFEGWWTSKEISYLVKQDDGITSYRGSRNSTEITGLKPNKIYNFRLRLSSSNSYSKFSNPLEVCTLPLPPNSPTIIAVTDTTVLLKLYYGDGGGSKFQLQRKLIKVLSSSRKAHSAAKKYIEEGWVSTYEGSNGLVKCGNMLSNCIYQFRAKAINVKGGSGAWSDVVLSNTSENRVVLRAASAPEVFTIECTGDVVTGDLILFTERLFKEKDGGKLVMNGGNGLGMGKCGGGGVVTPRLNMSVDGSINGSCGGRKNNGNGNGVEFAGERTVAARVLSRRIGSTTQSQKVNNKRSLRMEVVWSSVSDRKRAGGEVLKEGVLIERDEGCLFNFETFRAEWIDENLRVASKDE